MCQISLRLLFGVITAFTVGLAVYRYAPGIGAIIALFLLLRIDDRRLENGVVPTKSTAGPRLG